MNRRTFLKTAGGGLGALTSAREWTLDAGQRAARGAVRDVVVVGAGAFGGWTALYLQEMGVAVTLIDQYGPGNSRSSSGGETRQIRAGYGDREMYTRWVVQAFDRWRARQAEWGRTLFFQTGELSLNQEWTPYLKSSKAALDKLGVENYVIQHDDLDPEVSAGECRWH